MCDGISMRNVNVIIGSEGRCCTIAMQPLDAISVVEWMMGKGAFPIRQVERMRLLCCLVIDILNIRNWGGIMVKSGVEMHSG
jgi:hypothetical protein